MSAAECSQSPARPPTLNINSAGNNEASRQTDHLVRKEGKQEMEAVVYIFVEEVRTKFSPFL